jgi:hypothetical protein
MEIIVLSISIVALAVTSIIVLAIVIYNQMLMVNEINKRLLLIAKESQEKERLTMAELESWIRSSGNIDSPVTNKVQKEEDEAFSPFEYETQKAENTEE